MPSSFDTLSLPENPLIIEAAKPEDAAGIMRVRKETWLATYPNKEAGVTVEDIQQDALDSEEEIAKCRNVIENPNATVRNWVAKEADGTVVGYGRGKRGKEQNEIYGLYVLPTHQGRGLGRELMQRVIDWLGDDKPITLFVATYSTAVDLYMKFGFEIIGEPVPGPSFASGRSIPSFKMVRPAKAE